MALNDHDKQLIFSIDEQVGLLTERDASDVTIINTLADFVPDLHCLINSTEPTELDLYLSAYPGCAYLITMLRAYASDE